MSPRYTLSFKPAIGQFGWHDPSAVLFEDGDVIFGVEEERFTRVKHAPSTFPENAIRSCLDFADIELSNLDEILLPYRPSLKWKIPRYHLDHVIWSGSRSIPERMYLLNKKVIDLVVARFYPEEAVRREFQQRFSGRLPPLRLLGHHRCHAASAFHPSGFDESLVLTIDAKGEYDATVVWEGRPDGLERIRTYKHPNSLGYFFGAVTEFLGFYANNGEGKVMGLAPYGGPNPEISNRLYSRIDVGVEYDVTDIVDGTIEGTVQNLESLFGRERKERPKEFSKWEKDLAYTAQQIVEAITMDVVAHHCRATGLNNVSLAGGVALNCKLNKQIAELDEVNDIFIQPVAHDAGLAIGAGMVDQSPSEVDTLSEIYLGPSFENNEIEAMLEKNKVEYVRPEGLESLIAEKISEGNIVGWFQGRMEMGPRALGNRSILADPRTAKSRDSVNRFVKHREEWRPFAPSMTEDAAYEYLERPRPSPFMINTFDIKEGKEDDLMAILHPADNTTRPQTVREDQNPRYHRLLKEFERITGVPVLLNTSFNDHAEPIVTTPSEALKDFYGMGLDILVLEDFVITKESVEL